MNEQQIVIVPMAPAHVPAVVDVHLTGFPDAFLSFLGPAFLRVLYEGAAHSAYGFGVVALQGPGDAGQVLGFAVGMLNPAAFYRELLWKRGWRFALAAIRGLLRRPKIVLRLLRARHYPSQTERGDHVATLGSVCVRPAYQGRGLGGRLVRSFLDAARARGAHSVNLTTDNLDNDAVNAFYQRLGFQCAHSFCTPEGRQLNEYHIVLHEGEVEGA